MALKTLVREQYQRVGRPLRGVEIGPWLGRSTVSMLAADLPLGLPLPFDNHLYEFITASTPDRRAFERSCEVLLAALPPSIPREMVRYILTTQWSWRVERKHQYFEQLWCFDTWRGIASETLQYFRETATGAPKRIFLDNIRRAGFGKVVSAVERTETAVEQIVPGPVDFIFIDGDHEFASVVADLYAVRPLMSPHTLLCGHDIRNLERWPGVRSTVDWFVQDYHVRANIWVANAGGLAHLQQAPEYGTISDLVNAVQTQQSLRYQDPVYCARYHIATRSSVASSDANREAGV